MLRRVYLLIVIFVSLLSIGVCPAQSPTGHEVPSVDAGIGPCSVEMTVTDESGKPVYGATVHIQIAYGFMGVRKADLDVGTNIDGKARFVGLPNKFDKGLQFKASKGDKEGTAAGNPATNCHAKHYIVIRKP